MKVAFSPCGEFLHISSIEAQDVQKRKKEKTQSNNGGGRISENKGEGELETESTTLYRHCYYSSRDSDSRDWRPDGHRHSGESLRLCARLVAAANVSLHMSGGGASIFRGKGL